MDNAVLLGASDWRHHHWIGSFYPADMPIEWQLAYFNSQFSCVWLPYAVWSRETPATVREWLNDTRGEFRFILEAGPEEGWHENELLGVFAAKLALHCGDDHPGLIWFDSAVSLRDLAKSLQARASMVGATYLLSRDGDIATMNTVADLLELL